MPKRTFEQWIKSIFGHPATDPEWFWDLDADTCEEDDETNAKYLTRLFSESAQTLREFNDEQIGQGLNLIFSSSCSNHAFTITGGQAPWPIRLSAIQAIFTLYSECFAVRCAQGLGHLNETSGRLNWICYMWWDVFPAWITPDNQSELREADEYLAVMARCLSLSNEACLEGALHGLGHWHSNFPQRVESIIDQFLRERHNLRPELALYARRARNGAVQ